MMLREGEGDDWLEGEGEEGDGDGEEGEKGGEANEDGRFLGVREADVARLSPSPCQAPAFSPPHTPSAMVGNMYVFEKAMASV